MISRLKQPTSRIRGTTPEVEAAARQLRAHLTPAEEVLWNALRNRQFEGMRFRCQYPIGNFITDFCCPACRLMIEVDGGIHQEQADYDRARTTQLEAHGYKVLRFTNDEVMNNLEGVLDRIRAVKLGIA
jgi:very-short-patch-repair endonuclease